MPSIGKIAAYTSMLVLTMSTVLAGVGWLLPTIHGINTDLMWMILPAATVVLVITVYIQITILVRMIRRDTNPKGTN